MSVGKRKFHPKQGTTHLDTTLIPGLTSTECLEASLSVGSTNRLRRYRRELTVSRGINDPLFDNAVKQSLLPYLWDRNDFDNQLDYLNNCRDEQGRLFCRNLKEYSTTTSAFSKFADKDYPSFSWNENYRKSLEELKEYFSRAHLRPISYSCDADYLKYLPKANTHSGYTYIETGYKHKGDNMEGIHMRFSAELVKAKEDGSLHKPILVGFRTQASGEYNDKTGEQTNTCKHKTRVVCMVDLIQILLELKYSYPLQKFMKYYDCYAGGKDDKEKSSIIHDNLRRFSSWWSLDYSSFDMTISSWLIRDAFSVLKCAFSYVNDDEWNVIVHDFINKDFVVDEGIVHSKKGVPSGSMFTQIIDSIVNILVVKTYFNSKRTPCRMIVMGDDNLIFHNLDASSLKDLASYISHNFGLMANEAKSSVGSRNQPPEFLSKFWKVCGQWRHPHTLLSKMLFPERYRTYKEYNGVKATPEHVITSYILEYGAGMSQLIDVARFKRDFPITKSECVNLANAGFGGAGGFIASIL